MVQALSFLATVARLFPVLSAYASSMSEGWRDPLPLARVPGPQGEPEGKIFDKEVCLRSVNLGFVGIGA